MKPHVKAMLQDKEFGHRVSDNGAVFWSSREVLVGVVRHLPNVEEVEWCAEHGDMSTGLYGFRLDAYTCWAFTQIDWSLYPDATDCDFIDVAVVPLGGDDT